MKIKQIKNNKRDFLDLLLLADEQESMIEKYLDRGDMFAFYEGDLKSICIVTEEREGIYEIKNIATYNQYQRRGYGHQLIKHVFDFYKGKGTTIYVGTGDVPSIISFYEHCGFERSHVVKNFFTDNYDHLIIEDGIQLVDMIYLKKLL